MKKNQLKAEFFDIVKDILNNEDYAKLANYKHHKKDILSHNILVAWWTFKICKKLKLDVVSGTRGAMLHDFFHYEWRDIKKNIFDTSHGKTHPFISYENACKHFDVNPVEKDIIVKHMFPITLRLPKYKESYVVSFVDKFVASLEFMSYEVRVEHLALGNA